MLRKAYANLRLGKEHFLKKISARSQNLAMEPQEL